MKEYIGYHGTTKENGENILATKEFKLAGTERDWLGRGVYFFEDDIEQAKIFVSNKIAKVKKSFSTSMMVIEVKIDIDDSKFEILNLLTDKDRQALKKFGDVFGNKLKSDGLVNYRHPEGFVIDFMCKFREKQSLKPIACVRAAYFENQKKPLYNGYGFVDLNVQLCVKKNECIVSNSIVEVLNDYG